MMLKSSLCGYSDAYILVKGTMTVQNTAAAEADENNTNKKVTFKNCPPFTDCISEINNIQVDNAKNIDVVMPMYNLIEYVVIIIRIHREVYGNTIEMNHL